MFFLRLFFVLTCVFATVFSEYPINVKSTQSLFQQTSNNQKLYRLPTHTYPETYDISIRTRVDLNNFDFSGSVKIGIIVNQTTREIVLHARQLTITDIKLFKIRGNALNNVAILPHVYDKDQEFINISTSGVDLTVGERLQLIIAYNGTLRGDNFGFYKSSYVNSNGSRT